MTLLEKSTLGQILTPEVNEIYLVTMETIQIEQFYDYCVPRLNMWHIPFQWGEVIKCQSNTSDI